MNQGVHYVDMIQWVMGGVKSVRAQMRTATHDITLGRWSAEGGRFA